MFTKWLCGSTRLSTSANHSVTTTHHFPEILTQWTRTERQYAWLGLAWLGLAWLGLLRDYQSRRVVPELPLSPTGGSIVLRSTQ